MDTLIIDLDDIGMGLEEFHMNMKTDNIHYSIIEDRIYFYPENMFEAIELLSNLQQHYLFIPNLKNNNILIKSFINLELLKI